MNRAIEGLIAAVLYLATIGPAHADNLLYGATSSGAGGELVVLNPTTGAVMTDIGPLVDAVGNQYAITGLAFSSTGLLYGSTSNLSPSAPRHLITINPASAQVTLIGPFNAGIKNTMADLTFAPTTGTLFGAGSFGADLYTINLATGAASIVGLSGLSSTIGSGLAANATGTVYGAPTGADQQLVTYDKTTGAVTTVATLSGAPFSSGAISAMAFDTGGILFGVNTDLNDPARPTHLISIDPTTGTISDLGLSLDKLDAIAFQQAARIPTLSEWGMIGLAGLLAGVGAWTIWRRRTESGIGGRPA